MHLQSGAEGTQSLFSTAVCYTVYDTVFMKPKSTSTLKPFHTSSHLHIFTKCLAANAVSVRILCINLNSFCHQSVCTLTQATPSRLNTTRGMRSMSFCSCTSFQPLCCSSLLLTLSFFFLYFTFSLSFFFSLSFLFCLLQVLFFSFPFFFSYFLPILFLLF